MNFVTLTTDWHKHDHYIGILKGKLLQYKPQCSIIDISHQISPYDISETAYVLSSCYMLYPKGSVHIMAVNSELSTKRPLLVIDHNEHFFLCSDCGLPNLLFPETELRIYKVEYNPDKDGHSVDLFAKTATGLLDDTKPESLGKQTDQYQKQIPFIPVIDENEINSRVIYIDSYSNIITNVTKDLFERVRKGRDFKIFLQSNFYVVEEISKSYLDKPAGEIVALFNSSNNLEIAVIYGNAANLLNISKGGNIRIQFLQKKADEFKLSGN